MIPFHQISISDDKLSEKNVKNESIDKYFSDYKYIVWNTARIIGLMKKNKDERILAAFEKVKPFSYKADIAKYYINYYYGGWYSDIHNFFVSPPPKTHDLDGIFFKESSEHNEAGTWAVSSSLFFSKPKNSILISAVQKCVENIENKYYGPHPLFVTGPPVLGLSAAEGDRIMHQKCYIGDFDNKNYFRERGFYFGKDLFCLYKPNIEIDAIPIQGGNKYGIMWYNKEVY